MVSSEKANGLAAPGRVTVMRTVETPVSGTLALRAMVPSALEVTVALCRVAPLAAFTNRSSSPGARGQLEPAGLQGPAADQGQVDVQVVGSLLGGCRAGAQQPHQQHGGRDGSGPEPTTHLPSFQRGWDSQRLFNRWRTTSSTSR
jgi:hypothetical protein